MAYIEVWKSGRLLAHRSVDEQQAQKGCRVRLGSAGEVRIAIGQTETLGEFEVRMFAGEPPTEEEAIKETASILPEKAFSDSPGTKSEYPDPDITGYRIIEALGHGGMGMVWRAEQLSTRREVALKLLIAHRVASPKAQARFQREVELTARLDHPNIARIYDSGLHMGKYYYAMELVDGLPLDKYVKNQSLSRNQILALMQKVCNAVFYAHLHAVIHRDLKPSNILISEDGQPHVLDFGLAKAMLDEDEALMISIEGQVAGTPAYMSPEQAAGHHSRTDTRTDVFSLGVIMYKLLTGHSPHDLSGAMFDLLHEIIEGKVRKPREIDKSIDPELEALLLKALAHKPEERYDSAGALATDIANYLDEEPLNARIPTTFYFLRKKALKYKKQVGIAVAVLAVILVTVLAAYTKVVSQRVELRAIKDRNKELEHQFSEILNKDVEDVESALLAVNEQYIATRNDNRELKQQLGWRSESEMPLSSIKGFSFVKPVNLGPAINSPKNERGPCLSSDGLSFYFDSRRPGGIGKVDIWVANRASVSEPWENAVNLAPINTSAMDTQPHISADNLSLFFTSDRRSGLGHHDIWVSRRRSTNDQWGSPKNLGPSVNTSSHEGAPSLSTDGLSLYFESNRPGGYGGGDIWVTTRPTVSDVWGEAVNLGPPINTVSLEHQPCISKDGRMLFFNTRGIRGGKNEIWLSTRKSISGSWGLPLNLGLMFDDKYHLSEPSISPDTSTLYFISSGPDGYGGADIWQIELYPSE